MAIARTQEIETQKLKILELEQARSKEKADLGIKIDEAVQQWRVLHGNTEAERKELERLRIEKVAYIYKKDNLEQKIVDLEEKVRILYG